MELMIVMMIIGILMLIAVPRIYRRHQDGSEAVLKEDLHVMRTAIDSYTIDSRRRRRRSTTLITDG